MSCFQPFPNGAGPYRQSFVAQEWDFLGDSSPGPSPILSAFTSYKLEKRVSKHPDEFGQGAIEGVAGPESANNAATEGAMVPMLETTFRQSLFWTGEIP